MNNVADSGYSPSMPVRNCACICRKIGSTRYARWGTIFNGKFRDSNPRERFVFEPGLEWKVLHYRELGRLNDIIHGMTGTFGTKELSKLYDPEHDEMWQRNWITTHLASLAKAKHLKRVSRGIYCHMNVTPEKQWTKQELEKEIKDRITYYYSRGGTIKFPNNVEGDILKLVHKFLFTKPSQTV